MAANNKYDRQLRLWGASGQAALGDTCVVLLRASAAGTETLKNLVLPGVGAFCVVDDQQQSSTSHASNFFVLNDNKNPRAQVVMELLQELNPDVSGDWNEVDDWHTVDFATIFASCSSRARKTKMLVVASDLEPPILERVAEACCLSSISLIVVQAYGLLGIVRLQTPALPIINPKPRDSPPDLRLTHPFPALQHELDISSWDSLDNREHSHIPFPLILLKLIQDYTTTANGKLPSSFSEKQAFQESVKAMSRDFNLELNFQEAYKNAYLAYSTRDLDLQHLANLTMRAGAGNNCNNNTASFHAMLTALDAFLKRHDNQPPLQGTIPDMTSSTERYVRLARVYQEQAHKDWQEMRSLLPVEFQTCITNEELTTFCRNVYSLDLYEPRTIQQEYHHSVVLDPNDDLVQDLILATMEGEERPDQSPLLWYLGLAACRLFYMKHGRYPGICNDYHRDVAPLQECILEMVHRYHLQETELVQPLLTRDMYAKELVRYGNAEIHTIASVIGGVASQEAVKIITGQYVPLDNTYVFNGIASVGGVYRF